MARRQARRTDSVSAAQERMKAASYDIPLPDGLKLRTKEEKLLWKQFSSMKLAKDWRVGDLVQLHEVVQLACRIREGDELLRTGGYVVVNQQGDLKENPLVGVVAKLRNQQRAIIRGLGLIVATEGRAQQGANRAAPSVEDVEAAKRRNSGGPSLLAVGN